jgi:hypothetical protein
MFLKFIPKQTHKKHLAVGLNEEKCLDWITDADAMGCFKLILFFRQTSTKKANTN